MLNYEWKKLLKNRKGLWLIVIFMFAELLSLLLFTRPYDAVLEENRQVYESYLAAVEGSLTPEKRSLLEAEMERLNTVHLELEQLKQDYYSGDVSEDEYREQFQDFLADEQRYVGFTKLYSQYIYVREVENRSLLYTGGWEVLLADQSPDYFLLLLLVILLTPVFCEEYSSRMNEILITQKRSARGHVRSKILLALLLAAGATAFVQLGDLLYCAIRFGLPHGGYSLQSIRSFGSCAKELTLWQAFCLQFALKELGYMYAALIMLALSVLLKKYTLTLMAGMVIFPLPFLTVNSEAFLRIPGPWGFILGSACLNGSVTYTVPQTGQAVVAYAEVTWQELLLLLAGALLLMGLLILLLHRKNANRQLVGRFHRRLALFGVLPLLLSSCATADNAPLYNSASAGWYAWGDYAVISSLDGSTLLKVTTGAEQAFPPDAFQGETIFLGQSLYGEGDCVYYLKNTTLHPSAGWDSVECFDVLAELNLSTMEERVIYQWNQEQEWFFSILEREKGSVDPGMIQMFFLHDSYLYYTDSSGKLHRMHLTTGKAETYLTDINTQQIAYDGNSLYYTDAYSRLVIRALDSGTEKILEQVIATNFLLTPEGIYFLNRRDGNALYHWNGSEETAKKCSDLVPYQFFWDESYLWLQCSGDDSLYRMAHDGSGLTAYQPDITSWSVACVPTHSDCIYLRDHITGALFPLKKDSLQPIS